MLSFFHVKRCGLENDIAAAGRKILALLRVVDALRLTAKEKVATSANWEEEQDCIISPAIKDEEAEKLFPKGIGKVKSYLRYRSQPNKA